MLTHKSLESRVFKSAFFTDEELIELINFMETTVSRRQVTTKNEFPEESLLQGKLHWHCMLCGHSWEGWLKINPVPPATCANCHKPNWWRCPKMGPHDANCTQCKDLIKRQLKEIEELSYLKEFAK